MACSSRHRASPAHEPRNSPPIEASPFIDQADSWSACIMYQRHARPEETRRHERAACSIAFRLLRLSACSWRMRRVPGEQSPRGPVVEQISAKRPRRPTPQSDTGDGIRTRTHQHLRLAALPICVTPVREWDTEDSNLHLSGSEPKRPSIGLVPQCRVWRTRTPVRSDRSRLLFQLSQHPMQA